LYLYSWSKGYNIYQKNRRIKQEGLKSEMVNEDWSMTKVLKLPSIFKFYDNKYGGRSKLIILQIVQRKIFM